MHQTQQKKRKNGAGQGIGIDHAAKNQHADKKDGASTESVEDAAGDWSHNNGANRKNADADPCHGFADADVLKIDRQ